MATPAGRTAVRINWAQITTSLGLKGQTVASLQAFKKRNEDVRRKVAILSEAPQEVDFSRYRAILKNQAVVAEIEKAYSSFKPTTYDLNKQLKTIEAFEAEAVKNAEATKGRVDMELLELEKTLKNIEEARPFEDLTVDDVARARPDIDIRTAEMASKGRWMPAGYKEKFGELSIL